MSACCPTSAGAKVTCRPSTPTAHGNAVEATVRQVKVPFGRESLQGETQTMFVEQRPATQLAPNRDSRRQVESAGLRAASSRISSARVRRRREGQSGDGDVSDDRKIAARVFVHAACAASASAARPRTGDKTGTLASPDVALASRRGSDHVLRLQDRHHAMDTVIADGPHFARTDRPIIAGRSELLAEYLRSSQRIALDGTPQQSRP